MERHSYPFPEKEEEEDVPSIDFLLSELNAKGFDTDEDDV